MDEGQRLLVTFEARLTKYERDLERAKGKSRTNFKVIQKDADALGGNLEKAFSVFSKGGVALAAIGGVALAFKEIAGSAAEVDREARKAGVTAKVWSQWTHVATATGMSIDGVTDALKELNIRGDEFAKTGKGSAQEAFERLGYTVTDVAERLRDPSRFLDEIIGKLQTLDAAAQTRVLDEVFGGTGAEQFAKVLGLSVTQVQKLRGEAATFSDQQIEAAKKIDAEFSTMWRNATVRMKAFAIDAVGVLSQVRDALNPGKDDYDKLVERYNSPEEQLKRLQKQRADVVAAIEREKKNTGNFLQQAELRNLETSLKAIDEQIHTVTDGSDEFKQSLNELSAASNSLSGAFSGNVSAASNFKAALTELKNLVPELKAELDTLAQSSAIDTAYQNAVKNARTMGEVMQATSLANRAKSVASFGSHDNMLDLIGAAEGTDKGRGYNETLDYGRWTGGAQNLVGMTLNQVRDLQRQMLADPANRATYGDGKGSSALGRYQITGRTLEGLIKELGLAGDRLFDENTQDELARALLRRRGNDTAGLRNEWEGLRRVDDGTIRNAYAGTPTGAQQLAPTDGERQRTELLKQQADARRDLNQSVEEGLRLAEFERSISGMSESQQRVELELYRLQEDARRSGITLSNAELQKMREKLTLTAQLDGKNREVAASAEGLKNAQQFFAEGFTQSLSGLLTGTTSLNDAVKNLLNSLIDATLQAALLGKGPLAGLFGGMGGGMFGWLFGGFSEGGYTGTGGKHQPAGIVHKGEYVLSKEATRRAGVGNLDALHSSLKGYSAGGYVGSAPVLRRPDLKAANHNTVAPVQNVEIKSTINVTASGGTPEQNDDMAKKISAQVDAQLRGVVHQELQKASRPGGYMSRNR